MYKNVTLSTRNMAIPAASLRRIMPLGHYMAYINAQRRHNNGLPGAGEIKVSFSLDVGRTIGNCHWRYVALVVVLWCPVLSSLMSVTTLR